MDTYDIIEVFEFDDSGRVQSMKGLLGLISGGRPAIGREPGIRLGAHVPGGDWEADGKRGASLEIG